MKRRLGALTAAFAAGLTIWGLWPDQVVTVRLPEENDRLAFAIRAYAGERVVFQYRHSVEQTQVEGVFEVRSEPGAPRLVLVQTRYGSIGSGLPTEDIGRTRREGGAWVVDSAGTIDGLNFRIHGVNAAELLSEGERMSFQSLPSGTLIHLSVERVQQWRYFLWRIAGR